MKTIKSSNEISEIFQEGKRYSNSFATFIVRKTVGINEGIEEHDHQGRVAFIAGKRNGNAVWRNAAKRRMREINRSFNGSLTGLDVLFVARRSIMDKTYSKVCSTCYQTLKRIIEENA